MDREDSDESGPSNMFRIQDDKIDDRGSRKRKKMQLTKRERDTIAR